MTTQSSSSTRVRFGVAAAAALLTAAISLIFGAFAGNATPARPFQVGAWTLDGAQTVSPPGFSPAIKEGGMSALDPIDRDGKQFWTISDRGPNGQVTVGGVTRRTFLAPAF